MIAAIYARKSTEQTGVADHEKSVTRQIDHATDYAAGKGWTVAQDHLYSDDGISGAEFANRPGFLRLMNALKPTPPFQVIIMSEESRLGREAIETAYALKQLVTAGVRVFFYLEDRERTLDSPTDKIMLSLTAYADELEREKARQRTYDAMVRKAKAGHVTGGRVFGYDNVEVLGEPDAQGRRRRRHVERRINETEADVVRRIFDLSGSGLGMTRIAKCLNADATPAPRPQQGRPRGWVASSVRQILYRSLYRGEIVWNKTKKRNAWGQAQVSKRPDTEWITVPAPHLRIVSDDAWTRAHARLAEARTHYLRSTSGRLWGRPPRETDSKYLLPGFARCGVCGGGMFVYSRRQGRRRTFFYACTAHHKRGPSVCANALKVPMAAANTAILAAIESDVLRPEVVDAALTRAVDALLPKAEVLDRERTVATTALATVEGQVQRLIAAISASGHSPALLAALQTTETRRAALEQTLATLGRQRQLTDLDVPSLRRDLRHRLVDWQGLLNRHVPQARQILRKLLPHPLTLTPRIEGKTRQYEFKGQASLGNVLTGVMDAGGRSTSGAIPLGIRTRVTRTRPAFRGDSRSSQLCKKRKKGPTAHRD